MQNKVNFRSREDQCEGFWGRGKDNGGANI